MNRKIYLQFESGNKIGIQVYDNPVADIYLASLKHLQFVEVPH